MTITALITSTLTTHANQNARKARQKEAEAKALYTLTTRLTDAADIREIAGIATAAISEMLGANAACLCFGENGMPEPAFVQQVSPEKQVRRQARDGGALLRKIERLQGEYAVGAEFYDWPIRGREATLGVLRVPKGRRPGHGRLAHAHAARHP